MANIKARINYPIEDGAEVVFRSPLPYSDVTGLTVISTNSKNGSSTSKNFTFVDAHRNDVTHLSDLFNQGAIVKVILDCSAELAYIQNADTNSYLEDKFESIVNLFNKKLDEFEIPDINVDGDINTHNTNTSAHVDIRNLISTIQNLVEGLSTRLNTIANSDDITLDQMKEIVAYIKANRTLIESVTTSKISVDKIVNNLTTTAKDKVLGADQGAALKSLIDAIPAWAKVTTKPTYTASEVGADPSGSAASVQSKLDTHTNNQSNPHGVTKSQIGLGNVENKSSANIRSEITKQNIVDALGYEPSTLDSGTLTDTVTGAKYRIIVNNGNIELTLVDSTMFSTDGYGTITLFKNPDSSLKEIDIPSSINGETITAIGYTAFRGSSIERVTIPNTVTEIGESAFEGSNLVDITIPENVNFIRSNAFKGCTSLRTVNIYGEIREISNGVFEGCTALESVKIKNPDIITSVGENAFNGCTVLTSIGEIDEAVVYGVRSVSSVNLPHSIMSIGKAAFKASGITGITIPNGVTSIANELFMTCPNLTKVIIHTGVTNIGMNAFYGCTTLTEVKYGGTQEQWDAIYKDGGNVVLSTAVKEYEFLDAVEFTLDYTNRHMIGYSGVAGEVLNIPTTFNYDSISYKLVGINRNTFHNCTGLKSVVIPNCIKSIKDYTFGNCTSLQSVTLPAELESIGNNAFDGCNRLESITIPNTVKSIGGWSFRGCTALRSINIPEGVTNIGLYTFDGCSDLRSINIPSTVTEIGEGAFQRCTTLSILNIPNGVTSVGENAFNGCTGLQTIEFPNTVTSINEYAFNGCTGLQTVYYRGTQVQWDAIGLTGASKYYLENATIVYNYGKTEKEFKVSTSNRAKVGYTGAENEELIIPSTFVDENYVYKVTQISNYAFNNATKLKSIVIPEGVTNIGMNAFSGCTALESVTLPSTLTNISNLAFNNCNKLKSITFKDGLAEIGMQTFFGCSSLTTITIPDSVLAMGTNAFANCTGLKSITFGNGLTEIPSNAFQGCRSLTNVNIPSTITDIGSNAFNGCSALSQIIFNYGLLNIGNYAFAGCNLLYNLNIPLSVINIHDNAFQGCVSLRSLNIPANIERVNDFVFQGCTALTELIIEEGVKFLGNNSFDGCTALDSVKIPDSVTAIDNYTFAGCTALTEVVIPAGITNIGLCAFNGCTGLTTVKFKGTEAEWNNNVCILEGNDIIKNLVKFTSSNILNLQYDRILSVNEIDIDMNYGDIRLNNDVAFSNTDLLVPYQYNYLVGGSEYQVLSTTGIQMFGFANKTGLRTVILEGGPDFKTIKDYAFRNCSDLETLVIPASVTGIGDAFYGCDKLTNVYFMGNKAQWDAIVFSTNANFLKDLVKFVEEPVELVEFTLDYTNRDMIGYTGAENESLMIPETFIGPDGVKYKLVGINRNTFHNCTGLKSVVIPNCIKSIKDYTFGNCTSLQSVTLPAELESIGNNAFQGCAALESITIPNTVKSIGGWAFDTCSTLRYVNIPSGIEVIKESTFYACSSIRSFTIPNSIRIIEKNAFNGCYSLEVLELPEGVVNIGVSAFSGCSGLKTLKLPSTLGTINEYAFYDCYSINEAIYNGTQAQWNAIMIGISNDSLIDVIKFAISSTNPAFEYNRVLTADEITIDMNYGEMSVINPNGFSDNTALLVPYEYNYYGTQLYITGIQPFGFNGATGLKSIILEGGSYFTAIVDDAFNGCSNLESIVIPASVTSIGYNAFKGCNKLTNIYFTGTQEQWNAIVDAHGLDSTLTAYNVTCNCTTEYENVG